MSGTARTSPSDRTRGPSAPPSLSQPVVGIPWRAALRSTSSRLSSQSSSPTTSTSNARDPRLVRVGVSRSRRTLSHLPDAGQEGAFHYDAPLTPRCATSGTAPGTRRDPGEIDHPVSPGTERPRRWFVDENQLVLVHRVPCPAAEDHIDFIVATGVKGRRSALLGRILPTPLP